ncbi:MAG: hypothetical protein CYG59_08760 [Chloroflexi bacterium]|nr:MAG: hypothetical protein CYG59_08760 [Chloroflexota bacterium]
MPKTLAEMPAAPFTGHEIAAGEFAAQQARMAQAHGPIFRWSIPEGSYRVQDYVFMVGPDANRFVLHTHREHFSHDQGWTPIIGEVLGKGLLNMDDPEHAVHRRMWNPAFTSACMEAYLPVIQQVIADRTRRWSAHASVNVYHEAREITFDAAAACLAGLEPGAEVDRLRELFYALLYGAGPVANASMGQHSQIFFRARAELVELLLRLIAQRRALPAAEQPRDVLGMIVHATDDEGRTLSDRQVLAHLNILLVAGHETTTTLSAWALYLLAAMPHYQQRLRAELVGRPGRVDGPPAAETLRGLKALDYFVRETGRLYSPVLNVPRGVVKDFEFGGYSVPAGTPVRLALAAGHRLPHVFAQPEQFDPERFAPPREEDKRHQYSLVTFGGGSRICIGINFANIEVKALLAHVLHSYELEPVPGQRPVHAGHWTAIIPDGVRLRVRARAEQPSPASAV